MTKVLSPPPLTTLLEEVSNADAEKTADLFLRFSSLNLGVGPRGEYLHWDKLRHLKPPEGLTHEEWWLGAKLARRPLMRDLPLKDGEGRAFGYSIPDAAQELLHFIDQHASGEIKVSEVVTASDAARRHYLVNSLIEEAIRSSQLEGADTTHQVAKEMIQSGRPPTNRSELMIVNNYRAMEFMLETAGPKLTSEIVLELQRIVTDGTLDNPEAAGRLQTPKDERIIVSDRITGSILHVPPPAEQLPKRLEQLCRFANGAGNRGSFLHPVVRAILVHFWLAYDHPFEDGNGRTARALFYWSMQTQGYWLTEYLSISRILRQAPSQYIKSFLYTETDDRDTTYFVLYQLGAIRRAIEELHVYLSKKMAEVQEVESLIQRSDEFNYRQLALLSDAVRHPDRRYTFKSHSRTHKVTHQTARTDLLDLRQRGLLKQRKSGRQFVFAPPKDLARRVGDYTSVDD
jgi:Fic family protein